MASAMAAKTRLGAALLPPILLVALIFVSPLTASAYELTPWVGGLAQHSGNGSDAANVAAFAVPMRHVSVSEDEDEPEMAARKMRETTAATAAAVQCLKPTVKGYTSAMLMEPGLFLNWKIMKSGGVAVAIHAKATTTAARGWIAVAWSTTGLMSPAEAIVGNLPHGGLQGYKLNTYTSVVPTNSLKFQGKTVSTATAGTIIRYPTPAVTAHPCLSIRSAHLLCSLFIHHMFPPACLAFRVPSTNMTSFEAPPPMSFLGALSVTFACNGATGRVPGNPNTPPPPPYKAPPIQRSYKCPVSSLPTFIYMTDLAPGLVLHWRLHLSNVVEVALEAQAGGGAESGWLALGWSANGRMGGSETIIGNKAAGVIGTYDIMSYSMTSIQPKIMELGDAAMVYRNGKGSTVMK
ncbi:unnamed protein product [Closterium sp. NIES-54]